jgi:hypothetical protein
LLEAAAQQRDERAAVAREPAENDDERTAHATIPTLSPLPPPQTLPLPLPLPYFSSDSMNAASFASFASS